MRSIIATCALFVLVTVSALSQVTLYNKAIGADGDGGVTMSAGDTVFYDISRLKWFGLYIASDSDASFIVYVSARGSAAGNAQYASSATAVNTIRDFTKADSLVATAGTTGDAKFLSLRSPVAETIPFGANFLMIRIANKASGNGSTTKLKRIVLDGVMYDNRRLGE